jgi:HD-like signal output (HDOD) protein
LTLSRDAQLPIPAAEREVFAATHGEVAGYLLGIWGLSDAVVEAVTYHHDPGAKAAPGMSVLTAVYAANAFDEAKDTDLPEASRTVLDMNYFTACGLGDRVAGWQKNLDQAA